METALHNTHDDISCPCGGHAGVPMGTFSRKIKPESPLKPQETHACMTLDCCNATKNTCLRRQQQANWPCIDAVYAMFRRWCCLLHPPSLVELMRKPEYGLRFFLPCLPAFQGGAVPVSAMIRKQAEDQLPGLILVNAR